MSFDMEEYNEKVREAQEENKPEKVLKNITHIGNRETQAGPFETPESAEIVLEADDAKHARAKLKGMAEMCSEADIPVESGVGLSNSPAHVSNLNDWLFGLEGQYLGGTYIEQLDENKFKIEWPEAAPEEAKSLMNKLIDGIEPQDGKEN
jgi:hypothetical protein